MVGLRKELLDIVQSIWKELLPLFLPLEKGLWQLLPLPQRVNSNKAHLLPCVLLPRAGCGDSDLGCFSAELATHRDLVQGAVWSRDGALLSTTCKVSRWAVRLK